MSEESIPGGHIQNVGVVNLLAAKTAEDLLGITRISNVCVVLVPEHLSVIAAKIPMENVGNIAAIPSGENVNLQVGQIKMVGEALANGDPERVLVVVGQLIITTPVTSVGFKGIQIFGQVLAQRGSEAALGSKLTNVNGQVFYLPGAARLLMGDERIGAEFLELLPDVVALVVMGELTIESDVTSALLKSKITEIVLFGEIHVPKALLPITQVLTAEKYGEINTYE